MIRQLFYKIGPLTELILHIIAIVVKTIWGDIAIDKCKIHTSSKRVILFSQKCSSKKHTDANDLSHAYTIWKTEFLYQFHTQVICHKPIPHSWVIEISYQTIWELFTSECHHLHRNTCWLYIERYFSRPSYQTYVIFFLQHFLVQL